ncbi:amidohydrolase family protein [Micromonospora profundi]|uniref:amidohydrolase family protein n=1 Tax=Micromonospora profundi TaxID=1420889 RepID=UPI003665FB79
MRFVVQSMMDPSSLTAANYLRRAAAAAQFVIRADGVFDGRTGRTGEVFVAVQNGLIRSVGESRPAGDVPVLDFGPDSWLLPGLIDTHVHLVFDSSADPVSALGPLGDDELLVRMREAAAAHLDAGVTSVRDLGDRLFLSRRLALHTRVDPGAGPHVVMAGPPITTPGGHCHFLGGAVDGIDELRAAVRERARRGCSVVKIMVSGGNMTAGSDPATSQFTHAELVLVVEEAHRLGMSVAADTHGVQAITDAVRAGVDTLEHVTFINHDGTPPPDALLYEIANSGVIVSATLGRCPQAWAELPDEARKMVDQWGVRFGELHRRGARLAVGTDAGIAPLKPHGVLPYAVVELIEESGLSPTAALTAVTVRAAEACGLADRKGFVAPGMDADLLVVGSDPLADPAALHDVRAVFRNGIRVRGGRPRVDV